MGLRAMKTCTRRDSDDSGGIGWKRSGIFGTKYSLEELLHNTDELPVRPDPSSKATGAGLIGMSIIDEKASPGTNLFSNSRKRWRSALSKWKAATCSQGEIIHCALIWCAIRLETGQESGHRGPGASTSLCAG